MTRTQRGLVVGSPDTRTSRIALRAFEAHPRERLVPPSDGVGTKSRLFFFFSRRSRDEGFKSPSVFRGRNGRRKPGEENKAAGEGDVEFVRVGFASEDNSGLPAASANAQFIGSRS